MPIPRVAEKPAVDMEEIFVAVEDQFVKWMKTKPTGRFAVSVTVNQGGIRGKPQITKIENLE